MQCGGRRARGDAGRPPGSEVGATAEHAWRSGTLACHWRYRNGIRTPFWASALDSGCVLLLSHLAEEAEASLAVFGRAGFRAQQVKTGPTLRLRSSNARG